MTNGEARTLTGDRVLEMSIQVSANEIARQDEASSSVGVREVPDGRVNSMTDRERLDAIHRMACICCVKNLNMLIIYPTEAHHIVDKGYREHSGGHQATLPLCRWHHRAEPFMDITKKQMLETYGPSLEYQGKKGGFVERYGTQRGLLAEVNAILEQANG